MAGATRKIAVIPKPKKPKISTIETLKSTTYAAGALRAADLADEIYDGFIEVPGTGGTGLYDAGMKGSELGRGCDDDDDSNININEIETEIDDVENYNKIIPDELFQNYFINSIIPKNLKLYNITNDEFIKLYKKWELKNIQITDNVENINYTIPKYKKINNKNYERDGYKLWMKRDERVNIISVDIFQNTLFSPRGVRDKYVRDACDKIGICLCTFYKKYKIWLNAMGYKWEYRNYYYIVKKLEPLYNYIAFENNDKITDNILKKAADEYDYNLSKQYFIKIYKLWKSGELIIPIVDNNEKQTIMRKIVNTVGRPPWTIPAPEVMILEYLDIPSGEGPLRTKYFQQHVRRYMMERCNKNVKMDWWCGIIKKYCAENGLEYVSSKTRFDYNNIFSFFNDYKIILNTDFDKCVEQLKNKYGWDQFKDICWVKTNFIKWLYTNRSNGVYFKNSELIYYIDADILNEYYYKIKNEKFSPIKFGSFLQNIYETENEFVFKNYQVLERVWKYFIKNYKNNNILD